MQQTQFGSFTVSSLRAGDLRLDGGAMFGVVPKTLWERTNPPDAQNRIAMTMRVLLIRHGDRVILVDTGVGTKDSAKFREIFALDFATYTLEGQLAAAGLTPADVTDVILTHLHFDHVGGAVQRGDEGLLLTFPQATHYVQRVQWEWALAPSDRDKASYIPDNYLPLREHEKLALLDGDTELFPGLFLRVVNGHTFGQQLVELTDGARSLVYCADLVPMSAHVPAPYIMGYDLQPYVTLQEKKHILDTAATRGDVLVFEHDPGVEAARITRDIKGFRIEKSGGVEDVL
ncbi:MAG: MBL fold metallo-hydrolase [Ignavibacteriae bacterium]|nr:MBL fold metallo-hydrolase [Ignavibacteriota bacterium]